MKNIEKQELIGLSELQQQYEEMREKFNGVVDETEQVFGLYPRKNRPSKKRERRVLLNNNTRTA